MVIDEFKPELLTELFSLRKSIENSVKNPAFFNWPEDVFKQELFFSRVWVARDPGAQLLKGFLFFREESDRFEIMVLGTSPEFKNQGVMSQFLLKLQRLAAQQDRAIGLEVHEKNEAARRLYLKLGFKMLHLRKNYYKDGAGAELYLWKSPR